MHRHAIVVVFLIGACGASAAQTAISSDPTAVSLAQRSVAALTGGVTISDVSLNANVISIFGSDYETGTAVLRAAGLSQSRIDLTLNKSTRSDVRNAMNGAPGGAWQKNSGKVAAYANHNCSTDASWFFPALSSLAQFANPKVAFQYVGQEQHGGGNTQHVRVFQLTPADSLSRHLSTVDFYLDPTSLLPLAIAFNVHPDLDAGKDIPAEVRFANYQSVGGVRVPFHIQQMLNGGVVLDLTVTSAAFNTGLPSSTFSLQ
jgi:hypothetical protein